MRRDRLGAVRVAGQSMQPTLQDGDFLLVRWGAPARPGALVVVRLPGGRPLGVKRAVRREADGWWVERDNPHEGVDSWGIGAIPDGDVLARVVLRYWPLPRLCHWPLARLCHWPLARLCHWPLARRRAR